MVAGLADRASGGKRTASASTKPARQCSAQQGTGALRFSSRLGAPGSPLTGSAIIQAPAS